MDNFNELNLLVGQSIRLREFENRINSIIKCQDGAIVINEANNGRYTFNGIASIIGEDKMASLIDHFKSLIAVELFKQRILIDEALNKYKIIKEI